MNIRKESGSAPLFVVMMAAAMGLLIAFALAKLTAATGLLTKSAQLEAELNTMVREINGVIADSKACPGAFRDNADAKVVANPVTAGGAGGVTVNRVYAGLIAGGRTIARLNGSTAGLVITQMDLESPQKISSADFNIWEMSLKLRLEKKLDAATALPGSAVLVKKFRMSLTLDGGNHIIACSPLGTRGALGPMSSLRSTISTTAATCINNDAEKETLCGDLTPVALPGLPANPQQYHAATQGDVLAYGMLLATPQIAPPAGPPGFGLWGLNNPLYGRGGVSSWALYAQANADAPCTVMCVHKDAPIRFTRTPDTAAANATLLVKDAKCKTIGPNYIAATFNDFALAGWSSTSVDPDAGAANVARFTATIGGHDGDVEFRALNLGTARVIYWTGAISANLPVGCVRRSQ